MTTVVIDRSNSEAVDERRTIFAVIQDIDCESRAILAAIAITTVFARSVLMPFNNTATDTGARGRLKTLNMLLMLITLAQIAAAGVVIVGLAQVA